MPRRGTGVRVSLARDENGADRDLNEDGWYCMKTEASEDQDLPGNGNNGNNGDIKDNNRPNP